MRRRNPGTKRSHVALRLGLGLAACSLLAAPVHAQLGLKAGASFATRSDSRPDLNNRTGFAAGLSLPLPLGPIFALQPEALYVEKGWEGFTNQKLTYLEVPLFLRANIPVPGISPFGLAGASASFRLSCKTNDVDCPSGARKTDYGVALGAGVRLGGLSGLTLEGRYTWGLRNVSDVTTGLDSKTRSFLALVGVEF